MAKPLSEKSKVIREAIKANPGTGNTELVDLINKKRSGVRLTAKAAPKTGGNVINLMDALKKSLASERQAAPPAAANAKGKKPRKAASGQREMLLPISGKRAKEEPRVQEPKKAEKPVRTTAARSKKAG